MSSYSAQSTSQFAEQVPTRNMAMKYKQYHTEVTSMAAHVDGQQLRIRGCAEATSVERARNTRQAHLNEESVAKPPSA